MQQQAAGSVALAGAAPAAVEGGAPALMYVPADGLAGGSGN